MNEADHFVIDQLTKALGMAYHRACVCHHPLEAGHKIKALCVCVSVCVWGGGGGVTMLDISDWIKF